MSRILRASVVLDDSPRWIRSRRVFSAQTPQHDDSSDSTELDAERETEAEGRFGERPSEPLNDQLRQLLASVEESVVTAEQMRSQSLQEFQQLAVELAVVIAGELVHRAIDAGQFDTGGLVAQAIQRIGLDTPLAITLHPEDLQMLVSQETEEPPVWQREAVTLRPDATLPRGHCRASNGSTILLSELGPRLEEIRDLLLEGLDDAQIERRRSSGIGSPLKRFPDRRETA